MHVYDNQGLILFLLIVPFISVLSPGLFVTIKFRFIDKVSVRDNCIQTIRAESEGEWAKCKEREREREIQVKRRECPK